MVMTINVVPKVVYPPGQEKPGQSGGQSPIGGQFGISSRQWIRAIQVLVGGAGEIDCSNLRVEFVVRQRDLQIPNWCRIIVYNLSEKTTTLGMIKEFKKLTVKAGYQGRIGPIFEGQVMQKREGKLDDGVTKYFEILATSNNQAYGYSRLNKTLEAGHTFRDIVNECLKEFKKHGVKEGFIDDLGKRKMPRPAVLHGMCRDILRDVAFATNTSWSIQNETFQMVKVDGYLPGEAKKLNSDTGMIGLPEQTITGIVVKCLLDSGIKYKSRVHIDQKSIQRGQFSPTLPGAEELQEKAMAGIATDGIYEVIRVDHDGDTHGTPWYTTLTCHKIGEKGLAKSADQGDPSSDNWHRGTAEEDKSQSSGGGGPS